jgi:hypothetical protein
MMHSDPDSLVAMAQLVLTLARQIHPPHVANPGLARSIRQAGTAIARSVAAAHLTPGPVTGGRAMRHRLRACEQALHLIELLQQAIDAGPISARKRSALPAGWSTCSKPAAEPPTPGAAAGREGRGPTTPGCSPSGRPPRRASEPGGGRRAHGPAVAGQLSG